ncbi:MAG TPA: D-hexose-6-phosphate mutarotase [Candidatus Binatia bacterium]|nr:D-hexose-6-phosphate mutarotase [Candidatus Binatia bacterium]
MTEPVVIDKGEGGLDRARVAGPRGEAEVYLQGAHVTRWQPRGARPVLFVSSRAVYAPGKAIRGGVPLIFPWFGAHGTDTSKPMHGFARSRPWRVTATGSKPDGTVTLELGLDDDEATRALWPHPFRARYRVTAGDTLGMALEVVNTGTAPFTFEAALHTYLTVGDVRTAGVSGLENTLFIDKVDGFTRKRHGAEPLRLTGETDRVFLGTRARCVVDDPGLRRRLSVDKTGSASTVVWNPWAAKTAAMADMGPDDWRSMICVETANAADDAVTVAPGGTHVMTATIGAEAM